MLDEVADSKDTILHVSEVHAEYISKHDHKYLVLEGNAKPITSFSLLNTSMDQICMLVHTVSWGVASSKELPKLFHETLFLSRDEGLSSV